MTKNAPHGQSDRFAPYGSVNGNVHTKPMEAIAGFSLRVGDPEHIAAEPVVKKARGAKRQ